MSERLKSLLRGEVDQLPVPEKPLLTRIVDTIKNKFPILFVFFRSDIPLFSRIWTRTSLRFRENPPAKTLWNEIGISNEIRRFLGQRENEVDLGVQGIRKEYQYVLTREDYRLLNEALSDQDIGQIIQLTIEHGNVQSEYYEYDIPFDYNSRLKREVQTYLSDDLMRAYYSMMFEMTYLSILSESVNTQGQEGFVKDLNSLAFDNSSDLDELKERALYWYERLNEAGKRSVFVDRREIPFTTEVSGFEMCPFNPSNFEIATIVADSLPCMLTMDDILSVRYIDVGESKVRHEDIDGEERSTIVDTCGVCKGNNHIIIYKHPAALASYELDFEVVREYITRQQIDDLRHEIGHAWQNVIFEQYPTLPQLFIELLERDQTEREKDLFDPELPLSTYSKSSLRKFDSIRYLREVMAELWSISFNEEQVAVVEKELPGEAEILRCMRDEDYFREFLSKNNIL